MPNESSSIASIAALLASVAALAPLAKAIGNWHLQNKKLDLSKVAAITANPNQDDPNLELAVAIQKRDEALRKRDRMVKLLFRLQIVMMAGNLAMGITGAAILVHLANNTEPLHTGNLARIMAGGILIYLGWIKPQPWEQPH
jgi:hypothetical protein